MLYKSLFKIINVLYFFTFFVLLTYFPVIIQSYKCTILHLNLNFQFLDLFSEFHKKTGTIPCS